MVLLRDRMTRALAEDTGQSVEQITQDIDRDYILRGDDAVAYGLVDHILDKPEVPAVEALR